MTLLEAFDAWAKDSGQRPIEPERSHPQPRISRKAFERLLLEAEKRGPAWKWSIVLYAELPITRRELCSLQASDVRLGASPVARVGTETFPLSRQGSDAARWLLAHPNPRGTLLGIKPQALSMRLWRVGLAVGLRSRRGQVLLLEAEHRRRHSSSTLSSPGPSLEMVEQPRPPTGRMDPRRAVRLLEAANPGDVP